MAMSLRKKILIVPLALSLFLPESFLSTADAADDWYTDVSTQSSTYDGVFYLYQSGIVEGYEDGTFKPDQAVNRVEALKMILGATSHDATSLDPTLIIPTFPDMDLSGWYTPYVNLAWHLGVLAGNDDGTLAPETTVNRVEALKMLILAADKKSDLPSIESDYWYSAYLQYGIDHALVTPDSTNDYLPAATLTRGELCDLIYRFQKEPYTGQVEYGIASYYGRSFDGHNTASGTALDTDGFMAAHKTLAFGTIVRITNTDTNTFVDVTVVDRGPYTEGYIIDLTPTAFENIGTLSAGLLHVRLEVLK